MRRTTFVRQAANLWAVKAQLRQQLLGQISFDPQVSILDSFPMPVCRFTPGRPLPTAGWAGRLWPRRGAKQTFYGVRAHLRVCWPGVIAEGHLAPANLHDLALADDLLADAHGWCWVTGPPGSRPEPNCWPTTAGGCWRGHARPGGRGAPARRLTQARRRIETVIGQLVERYHAKRVWARDAWHLWSRWQRKLLSHTLAVYLCQQTGLGSLRFADLLTIWNPHTRLATCP